MYFYVILDYILVNIFVYNNIFLYNIEECTKFDSKNIWNNNNNRLTSTYIVYSGSKLVNLYCEYFTIDMSGIDFRTLRPL